MKLNVNFEKRIADIKAMHAVGQPPRMGISAEHMHYLTDANIPYSRLHDVGGAYGGNMFVDIPNLFRDFSANEFDPASYDFAFTDILIKQIFDAKCEPIFRLGVTIENYQFVKAYRVYPPSDFAKWARICEHVIRHYNEGWANGYRYGIKYWEIWNEPDNGRELRDNQMWQGTMEEYFELYEVASKHLKKRFGDSIKVGGFASCGFYSIVREKPSDRENYFTEFALKFLDYVKQTGSPMDFFSWHSYSSVTDTIKMADFIDAELTKRGFGEVETQLNEWNNAPNVALRGTGEAAAKAAAMMLAFQNKKTDILCYYDARIGQSVYGGLFHPMTYKPLPAYYGFVAFGELYALGGQVEVLGAADGVYAIAATDGEKRALMLANIGEAQVIETGLDGCRVRTVDDTSKLEQLEVDSAKVELGKYQVMLITNY